MNHLKWKIVDSGKRSAIQNMEKDSVLLKALEADQQPILHFYEWERDSATYGYFVKPEKYLNLKSVNKRGLDLARRPTGGGIVFHLTDLAFSVLLPSRHVKFSLNTMSNYTFINEIVKEAVIRFMGNGKEVDLLSVEKNEIADASFFCMAKPTKYDLILNGKKVGGAAERATRFGLLHQATIALQMPEEDYLNDVLQNKLILNCMKKNSSLLLKDSCLMQLQNARNELKLLLMDSFTKS